MRGAWAWLAWVAMLMLVAQPATATAMGGGSRGAQSDRPDDGLPKIAAATGGGYFELTGTDDLNATFTRVADELHHQYALGFTPAKLDGKMHTLDVKIAKEGMAARARKSYLATAPRS